MLHISLHGCLLGMRLMPLLGLILVLISLFVTTVFWLLPIIFVRFLLTISLRRLRTASIFLLLTLCCSRRSDFVVVSKKLWARHLAQGPIAYA